ncbi:GGDEF domain-containing protein [Brevibacillus sp. HB1.2]|uniref:CBS domain-containing protein n=1 Tax=unclassified Brevibacillus TaxID=2684853 RepID=UPI001576A041|nr:MULTISPECIES: GGDEF domain-containing protein [unclassified Brevibacillus]NTU19778.1 GGDEF domain-containing protein [Brevibacillus sp. HB1.2]NTU29030.1 GGDEF domain-containing protein [Brevibacillus sp. HB1.1]
MNISDIMTTTICTITSDKSVSYAAERMNESHVDSLVVMDHGEVLGMVTTRDVLSAHPNRIVADAMSSQPFYLSANHNVWEAYHALHQEQNGLALVKQEDQLIGFITKEIVEMKIAEYRDPLSGLYRAPYIQFIGENFLKERKPFHLLFIDLNDFGRINKLHGHPFGDDVIRTYSSVLSSLAEEQGDYLCRYAGDEFVLISTISDEQIQEYITLITRPTNVLDVFVSAAVGHVNGYNTQDFFARSWRELIAEASLGSSAAKLSKSLSSTVG